MDWSLLASSFTVSFVLSGLAYAFGYCAGRRSVPRCSLQPYWWSNPPHRQTDSLMAEIEWGDRFDGVVRSIRFEDGRRVEIRYGSPFLVYPEKVDAQ